MNFVEDKDDDEYQDEYEKKMRVCYDGSWTYDGHCGMMVGLDNPDFLEDEYQEFLEEKEQDSSLDMEKEFVRLDFHHSSEEDRVGFNELLCDRGLCMASGLTRRFLDEMAPSRIRIRRLDEELEMKPLMESKKQGNEKFGKKQYEAAIDLYDEALMYAAEGMYIGPYDQVKQIVAVLSNKAECQLRLNLYDDAGQTATEALIYDRFHEKTRIRRAKAELAIAKEKETVDKRIPYLVQAEKDLNEVMDWEDDSTSSAAKDACKKMLLEVKEELNRTKVAFLEEEEKRSDMDWEYRVVLYRSYCC